jgi:hypothetical protein
MTIIRQHVSTLWGVIVRSLQTAENHLIYNIKYRIVLSQTGSRVVYNM